MDAVPLVAASVAVAVGVLAGGRLGSHALTLTAAALLACAAGAVAWRTRAPRALTAASLLVAIGLCGAADGAWRSGAEAGRLLPRLASGSEEARVCGLVTGIRPRSVEVRATEVRSDDVAWAVREPVRFTGDGIDALVAGQEVCGTGVLVPPQPGRPWPPLLVAEVIEPGGVRGPVRYSASVVRDRFTQAAQAALPDRQAGLLLGMTVGNVELLDDTTMDAFRTTGLAHIVAVSGAHVAVVLAMILLVCRTLVRRSRWGRVAVAAGPLVFYAVLTGLAPSVLRATVTAGIVLAVTASGRTAHAVRALCVAFCVLVLADPDLLTHPGFQLSVTATGGLILWAQPLTERLLLSWPRRPSKVVFATVAVVAVTVAAQAAVAPLLAWHFGRVPALGGVANLVIAPVRAAVMVGGLVTLTLASLSSAFAWAPATTRVLLDVILWTADTFAELPAASLVAGVAAATAIPAALAWFVSTDRRVRSGALALALVCAAVAVGQSAAYRAVACPDAEIRAVDIGGMAVLMRAGGGSVLYDGGPARRGLPDRLRDLGVGRVDVVVTSHPHADHTEGLVEVVERLKVGLLVGPSTMEWGPGGDLVAAARRRGVDVRVAAAGDVLDVAPGLRVDVLAPDPGPPPDEPSGDGIGTHNLVVRATVGATTMLLAGDANGNGQRMVLAAAPDRLAAQVMLAVHHGSSDLELDLVDAVAPALTLVTVDPANQFGHPTEVALQVYGAHGTVLRTDTQGELVVCVHDGSLEVTTAKTG